MLRNRAIESATLLLEVVAPGPVEAAAVLLEP